MTTTPERLGLVGLTEHGTDEELLDAIFCLARAWEHGRAQARQIDVADVGWDLLCSTACEYGLAGAPLKTYWRSIERSARAAAEALELCAEDDPDNFVNGLCVPCHGNEHDGCLGGLCQCSPRSKRPLRVALVYPEGRCEVQSWSPSTSTSPSMWESVGFPSKPEFFTAEGLLDDMVEGHRDDGDHKA